MREDHEDLKSKSYICSYCCMDIDQYKYCINVKCPGNEKACRNCGSDPFNPKKEYCPTCGSLVVDSDPTCYDPECYYKKTNSIISLELYHDEEVHTDKKEVPFKYNEKELFKEFEEYVTATYGQHYVGKDNVQSLDLIISSGNGEGFCIGNILKLAARYKKKKGQEHTDLLKIMHYALILLHIELKGKK